jgi:CubicO group peptidase (beta-lactamase class C family)
VRKLIVAVVLLLCLLGLAKPAFNISPFALGDVAPVASGLGAKLACSHRYLTGLSPEQIASDLASYSVAYRLVELDFDDEQRVSRANLFGLAPKRARYREGLGCTLEIGDTSPLDEVTVPTVITPSDNPWPAGESVDTLSARAQVALDHLLQRDAAGGYDSRALLIVRNGEVIAESYGDGFHASTRHLGWSMGKSVTAMLLGSLEYRNLLKPAETELFAAWSGDKRATISVENLLQATSGLAFNEIYAPGSDATRMLFDAHSTAAIAMAKPLEHPPGRHFSYSSGTTNLLAALLVERLGGTQAAVDYLYRDFLQPLGMANTVLELDPSGVFVGSSYIYASARDWGRLGQLMLDGGILNDHRLLARDWVTRATLPNAALNDPRYGYQFWLNAGSDQPRWPGLPMDAYAMMGNRGQVVMIIPSTRTVIVRLGWSAVDYPVDERFSSLLAAAF